MESKVIFLVDEVSSDECLGYTNQVSKIRHNLNRLPKGYNGQFFQDLASSDRGITVFAGIGRYVVMIAMAKGGLKGAMSFFDTKQDETLAQVIVEQFKSDNLKKGFMDQHYLLQAHYMSDYQIAVLSTDISPLN